MTTLTATDQEYTPLPRGLYSAKLADLSLKSGTLTDTKTQETRTSEYLAWKFEITEEGHDDRFVWANSSLKLTPSSKARPWVETLMGRALQDQEELETDDLVGRECILSVGLQPDGKGGQRNVIEAVNPVKGLKRTTKEVEPKGFPRRWNVAIKDSMKLWPESMSEKEVAAELRVQALGESYRDRKFLDLTTDEQLKLVDYAENIAAGTEVAF